MGLEAILGTNQHPVGTIEELRKKNINLRMVASCAPQSEGVKGCKYYGVCQGKFADWMLKQNGKQGPANVAVGMLSGTTGGATVQEMACYAYMDYPDKLRTQIAIAHAKGEDTGDVIEIIAYEGEMAPFHESRRKHPKPEPGCVLCAQGNCTEVEEYDVERPVNKFRRIDEAAPRLAFAEKLRDRMLKNFEREQHIPAGLAEPAFVIDDTVSEASLHAGAISAKAGHK